jgi:hypothetical protein
MAIPPRNPRISEKVVKGSAGYPFTDIADRKGFENFIKENAHHLKAQDKEIDAMNNNSRRQTAFQPGNLPHIRPTVPQQQNNNEEVTARGRQEAEEELIYEEDEIPPQVRNLPKKEIDRIMRVKKQQEKNSQTQQPKRTITNVDDTKMPINAPLISNTQMRKKIEQEIAEESKLNGSVKIAQTTASDPRFVLKELETTSDFVRVELVSGYKFYEFDDVQIRKLNITDIFRIYQAKKNNDITGLIDVVSNTLSIDGRLLTPNDFRHSCYWHRFNSYTATPLTIEWTSKYGNKNLYKIEETTLKFIQPKISRDEYWKNYVSLGLVVPTMREFEIFSRETLSEDELWLFEMAQYFRPKNFNSNSIQERIDSMSELCSKDISLIEKISNLIEDCAHGVNETIDLIDAKFDPKKWVNDLQERIDYFDNLKDLDDDMQLVLNVQKQELQTELDIIKNKLEKGEGVEAEVETRAISITLLDFFPRI